MRNRVLRADLAICVGCRCRGISLASCEVAVGAEGFRELGAWRLRLVNWESLENGVHAQQRNHQSQAL